MAFGMPATARAAMASASQIAPSSKTIRSMGLSASVKYSLIEVVPFV
jgi:hypothetical protein